VGCSSLKRNGGNEMRKLSSFADEFDPGYPDGPLIQKLWNKKCVISTDSDEPFEYVLCKVKENEYGFASIGRSGRIKFIYELTRARHSLLKEHTKVFDKKEFQKLKEFLVVNAL
jgi:hypothetical protein